MVFRTPPPILRTPLTKLLGSIASFCALMPIKNLYYRRGGEQPVLSILCVQSKSIVVYDVVRSFAIKKSHVYVHNEVPVLAQSFTGTWYFGGQFVDSVNRTIFVLTVKLSCKLIILVIFFICKISNDRHEIAVKIKCHVFCYKRNLSLFIMRVSYFEDTPRSRWFCETRSWWITLHSVKR